MTIKLKIIDDNNEFSIHTTKAYLEENFVYFRNLFDSTIYDDEISIIVPNAYVAMYVITKKSNPIKKPIYPVWKLILENIRFNDFMGMDVEDLINKLLKISIPDINLLIEIGQLIGFPDKIISIICYNLPEYTSVANLTSLDNLTSSSSDNLASSSSDNLASSSSVYLNPFLLKKLYYLYPIHIASCTHNQIILWSKSKERIRRKNIESISKMCSINKSTLAYIGYDKNIYLWNIITDKTTILENHKNIINCICSSGNFLASGDRSGCINIWTMPSTSIIAMMKHDEAISHINFSPDNEYLITSHNNSISLWNITIGKIINTVRHNYANKVCFSSDGKHIACVDVQITVYDTLLGNSPISFGSKHSLYTDICYTDNIIVLWESEIHIWNSIGIFLKTIKNHYDYITSIACPINGMVIVSGSWDNTVKIWDISSDSCINVLTHHCNSIKSICLLEDSQILSEIKRML